MIDFPLGFWTGAGGVTGPRIFTVYGAEKFLKWKKRYILIIFKFR